MNLIATVLVAGLLALGGAAAVSGHGAEALGHAAEKAKEMANGHAAFARADHRPAGDAPAERLCAEFPTHGAYVSHVAHEAANNSTAAHDHHANVSDAARSDVGQCGGGLRAHAHADEDDAGDEAEDLAEAEGPDGDEDDDEDSDEDDSEDQDHGRSGEQRSAHPPRGSR